MTGARRTASLLAGPLMAVTFFGGADAAAAQVGFGPERSRILQ